VIDALEKVVGSPVELEELKCKPGRRTTLRARGPTRSAIVKRYESRRAPLVAARVKALAQGPREPLIPEVLLSDPTRRLVVLSDLPGTPLREAVLAHDLGTCRCVGATLGRWHRAWSGRVPSPLRPHTWEREFEIVLARSAESASEVVAQQAHLVLVGLHFGWTCTTVVHRDLYEEQILVGRRVGMIDLDDAAAGPPELDFGNLWAHLQFLGLRRSQDLELAVRELLSGYEEEGPSLDPKLLDTFRRLTLVRLACLNDDLDLLELARSAAVLRQGRR
jgi:Ser/Thr protein kinase RdoA (MazF antagonist)